MRNQRIALFEKLTTTSSDPSEGSSLPPQKMDSLLRKDTQDRLLASTYIFILSHTQIHTYTHTHVHMYTCTHTHRSETWKSANNGVLFWFWHRVSPCNVDGSETFYVDQLGLRLTEAFLPSASWGLRLKASAMVTCKELRFWIYPILPYSLSSKKNLKQTNKKPTKKVLQLQHLMLLQAGVWGLLKVKE